MADQRHLIPEERRLAGQEILALTDRFGFDAYAAGWVHDRPTQRWKYLLVTPMLKSKGPGWVYERLLTLFRHYPLPEGISPLDIFVIDPDLEIALFGEPHISVEVKPLEAGLPAIGLHVVVAHDIRFEEFSVTDGFVGFYRRVAMKQRRRLHNPAVTFDHRVKHLQAA